MKAEIMNGQREWPRRSFKCIVRRSLTAIRDSVFSLIVEPMIHSSRRWRAFKIDAYLPLHLSLFSPPD